MATVFKNINGMILLRFQNSSIGAAGKPYIVRSDGTAIELKIVAAADNLYAISNDLFHIERIVASSKGELTARILNVANGDVNVEDLNFSASFFADVIDLTCRESLPPFQYGSYEKPKDLAIFTHASNEDIFLKIFVNHYKKYTNPENIYIIDHGSTYLSPYLTSECEAQVIRIPKGAVDHLNIKRYCEYFQRFLLTQYKWVMHIDCDELLIHKRGSKYFTETFLPSAESCVMKCAAAFDVLHDPEHDTELDATIPISRQRNYMQNAEIYAKPALSSIPTTWTLGFHDCLNDTKVRIAEDLCLIHLTHASIAEKVRRNTFWTQSKLSEADGVHIAQGVWKLAEEELIGAYTSMVKSAVPIPDWMRELF